MMMQLFYAAGASSMAPHILLRELKLDFELRHVNLDQKTWSKGDYNDVNPKSYVPVLELNDGTRLTECAVILEYLASHEHRLIADYDSKQYWQQRQWLNYLATELHKNFISPFRTGNWLPNTAESKALVWQRVLPRLQFVETTFEDGRQWLMGNDFSLVDPYLFVMTNWLHRLNYSFETLPRLKAFDSRMRERASVIDTFKVEGKPHALTDSTN
ncbi:glutathione S-transferase [Furfurilactobacillus rossiae DSM 15814]|uniref:Glutathione S-transferase n=2 Tax=Furfurilactobacillus rossiae TaxID=231049 RepID=A0A0R1RAV4_9LACO|nr:glutathione S-transferase [Furfurilactobacillus rossiae DSM 15814]